MSDNHPRSHHPPGHTSTGPRSRPLPALDDPIPAGARRRRPDPSFDRKLGCMGCLFVFLIAAPVLWFLGKGVFW